VSRLSSPLVPGLNYLMQADSRRMEHITRTLVQIFWRINLARCQTLLDKVVPKDPRRQALVATSPSMGGSNGNVPPGGDAREPINVDDLVSHQGFTTSTFSPQDAQFV
jgi:hypothetical protein